MPSSNEEGMSLHFFHGPASPQKRTLFFSKIQKQSQKGLPYRIIVPHAQEVIAHKTQIMQITGVKTLVGNSVQTWEGFLKEGLQKSLGRFHYAEKNLSFYLIFLLLESSYPSLLAGRSDVYKLVVDCYKLFVQLKSCGLTPHDTRKLLEAQFEDKEFFDLFEAYQRCLKDFHYFDQGDLYLYAIDLIKKKQFILPDEKETLYFSHIYPIRPGQREIFRQLKEHYPHVRQNVFYDEDFSQEERSLGQAFEDLGSLADEEIYVEDEKKLPFVLKVKNPYQEIDFIVNLIQKEIKNGLSPDQIALIVADDNYLAPLLSRCFAQNIPVSVQYPLGSVGSLHIEHVHDQEASKLIDQFRHTGNAFASDKLRLRAGLENVQAGIDFVRQRLTHLDETVSEERKSFFVKEILKHYAIPAESFPGKVVVTGLSQALAHSSRHVFCLGFHLESFVSRKEHTLFSNQLYSDSRFVELLESPSYLLKVTLEKIKQALSSLPHLFVTAPEFDFSDKPTTPLHLGAGYVLSEIMAPYPEAPVYSPMASDYFQSKKKGFSLSALEEYVNCPYRYYAGYHLKLDTPKISDVELAPDIKGQFVHKVLHRVIAENESDYLEGLEYESYRKKVVDRLGPLIQEEIDRTEEFKTYPIQMVEFFAYRVYKTIINLLTIEAKNYKDAKKRTVPMHYEWSFDYHIESISLRGRIDRIDVNQARKQFAIIDYKTGGHPSVADMRGGKSLQLPIYLMAVKDKLYPEGMPTGAYYYVLKTNEIKGFTLKDTIDAKLMHSRSQLNVSDWQDMQDTARHRVGQAVHGIHEGKFDPKPLTEQLCRFCDYKKICGYGKMDR